MKLNALNRTCIIVQFNLRDNYVISYYASILIYHNSLFIYRLIKVIMKACNLVLGLMLAANVLTAHSAVFVTAATTSAIVASNTAIIASHNNTESSKKTMASTVSSTIINSQNTTILGCTLEYERVTKDDEWIGTIVPSLEKTLNSSHCQSNKKTMEQLNNTHYKFGQVKGMFSVGANDHVMIELVQVNE